MNKIIFRPSRPWIDKDDKNAPAPTQSSMPLWYKEADRFAKNPIIEPKIENKWVEQNQII